MSRNTVAPGQDLSHCGSPEEPPRGRCCCYLRTPGTCSRGTSRTALRCMCVCVSGCSFICTCMHTEITGQSWVSFLSYQLPCFPLRQALLLIWNLPSGLVWLACEPKGSKCLGVPGTRITSTCYGVWIYTWVLGTELRSLFVQGTPFIN